MRNDKEGINRTMNFLYEQITNGGFVGFSQTFFYECNKKQEGNKCLIAVNFPSSDLTQGSVEIKRYNGKCAKCPVVNFCKRTELE